MSVIFPDGRQLRLSKYDNILDMLALAELENKRMRQDYLQDAEVDGIQGKRKKPIVYPTQAVPSLVSNLPPPPAGQQLPHPPTAPSSMPPVSEGQQKAHSPIISANIPPAPLQNIPGISPRKHFF
jgi:hypothetical protein